MMLTVSINIIYSRIQILTYINKLSVLLESKCQKGDKL